MQRMAEWLVRDQWAVRMVTTDAYDLEYFWNPRRRRVDAPARETINGVEVERLPVDHFPGSALVFQGSRRLMGEASRGLRTESPFQRVSRSLPAIPDLDSALRQTPHPDLIIGANLGLEGLPLAGLAAAQALDVPFVFLPFAHLGTGEASVARRYVSMPHQRALLRQADLVIALTHLEAEFLADLGAQGHRIVVAGAGVDLDCTRTTVAGSDNLARGEFTILSAGAMAPDKGTNDLVKASRMLTKAGKPHKLVLIGPELSSFTRWFEESGAAECGWIDRRGVVSDAEKRTLFQCADIFALASRTESFGIVYLEGWAAGLPVVGADAGAVSEVISHMVDGLLVPFGDAHSLASAVGMLIDDADLRVQLGESGHRKVSEHFTWNRVFERIGVAMERTLGIEVA